ncbi:hypothetical protein SBV42_05225 [Chlamydia crocodili]|uniref:Inclusion membrane protein n=1 Tax=Chlamydia crocodili TaxID=2766982 RepID=A0ABX8CDQ5_9CHLA|nr:hypothetical protein [Chlamydia crocodili]QVE49144.1 hypothetical protein H9Q19_00270 [Chlamydia crocodili]
MSCMANVKEVCSGLGRVDFSKDAVPSFKKKEHLCASITRVVLCALVAIMAIASIIVGCICCAAGGTSLYCGLLTIALSLLGVSWAAIVLRRMFDKKS